MKKGLIPVALGTVVTTTGVVLASNQSKPRLSKRNDYPTLGGTFLMGLGVAHILLGSIDIAKE